jgi:succinylarginine dihydrolase
MDKGIEKHDVTKPGDVYRVHGKPGNKPSWSSGAKTLVGTAASAQSRIWYTVANGTLNELYFPDVDQANTRSVRFLVSFFSDEQRDARHTVDWTEPRANGQADRWYGCEAKHVSPSMHRGKRIVHQVSNHNAGGNRKQC